MSTLVQGDLGLAPTNPYLLFQDWLDNGNKENEAARNIIAISTSTLAGKPSSRNVHMTSVSQQGLEFFTDTGSKKGQQLAENSQAAALLYWPGAMRQIEIEGTVAVLPEEVSQTRFQGFSRDYQLRLLALRQDRPVASRQALLQLIEQAKEKYRNEAVLPCPQYWRAYQLKVTSYTFYQGGATYSDVADVLRYTMNSDGGWKLERLEP